MRDISKRGIDEEYIGRISDQVSAQLSRYGFDRSATNRFLKDEQLQKEIGYLHRKEVSDEIIAKLVARSIGHTIREPARGGVSITPENLAYAIFERLRDNKRYRHLAEELEREGLIDKKGLKAYHRRLEQDREGTLKTVRSGALEELVIHEDGGDEGKNRWRMAAVYLSFAVSGFFLLKSLFFGGGYTAAVVGGGSGDMNMLYGVVFLLLGLAFSHFFHK